MPEYLKPLTNYFYGNRETRQTPITELLSEIARRALIEFRDNIMRLYQYLVSTFPQVIILLFIFLTYCYVKKVKKGRPTKSQNSINDTRSKQECNLPDNLPTLLPQHVCNLDPDDPNKASNVSLPRVVHFSTDPTVNAIHRKRDFSMDKPIPSTPFVPTISKYNPITDKFDIWIDQFESYMKEHNNEVSTWINILKHMLADSCKEQIHYMFRKPGATYDEIKRNISLMYSSNLKGAEDTLKIFCERKKKHDETYYQFAAHLEQLAINAHIPKNQLSARIIERFIEGIPATLKLEIMRQFNNHKPETIYDLIETVMSIERVHQQLADESKENSCKPRKITVDSCDRHAQYSTEYYSDETCAIEQQPHNQTNQQQPHNQACQQQPHNSSNLQSVPEPQSKSHPPNMPYFTPYPYNSYYQPLEPDNRYFNEQHRSQQHAYHYKNRNRQHNNTYPQKYQQLYPNTNNYHQQAAYQPQSPYPTVGKQMNQNNPQHLYQLTAQPAPELQIQSPIMDGTGLNK